MMHRKLKRLAIVAGLSLCAFAASAQTVTFNLTGNILPGVCRFTAADVDLGTFYATDFTAVGTTKTLINVPISSTGCDPLVSVIHMNVSGIADTAEANYFRGVAGIGIEMQTVAAAAIRPSGTNVNFNAVAGTSNYMLRARFRQTAAAVDSGAVRSAITIQVTYN